MTQKELDRNLFNIDLLFLNNQHLLQMKPVTNMSIFTSNTSVFHPEGLFSTEIFGNLGTAERLQKPGYIKLNVPVLHPLVYMHICSFGSKYKDIIEGKKKAFFNPVTKDFDLDPNGASGYEFFITYLPEIEFPVSDSTERQNKVLLVNNHRSKEHMLKEYLVLPAGLRDYDIDSKGRPTQDEVNDLYRKLLATTKQLDNYKITSSTISMIDPIRLKIQNILVEIFEYFRNKLDGKHMFIMGKWASRAIMNGTRNVITSNPREPKRLDSKFKITANHTIMGLYQYINMIVPMAQKNILQYFITGTINPYTNQAYVIDSKTNKSTFKNINPKDCEKWLTQDGLQKIFNKFKQDVTKNEPAKIGDDYIAMVYENGNNIHIVKDTNNLPDGATLNKLRPITYGELMYISVYSTLEKVRAAITRYPITNYGNIYISLIYLVTTTKAKEVTVHINGESFEVPEYPIVNTPYSSAMCPHVTHLATLGADFDGDTGSANPITSKEAVEEVDKLLMDKKYYLSPSGDLNFSISDDIIDYIIKHLARRKKKK